MKWKDCEAALEEIIRNELRERHPEDVGDDVDIELVSNILACEVASFINEQFGLDPDDEWVEMGKSKA